MIYAIIFFTLIFGCFAIYYYLFMIDQLWATKYKRVEHIHVVNRVDVYPLEFSHEFYIDDYFLNHARLDEKEIIRDQAARLISGDVYDLIKKDVDNKTFLITENKRYDIIGNRFFKIEVQILPIIKEAKYYGNGYFQIKTV